MTERTSKVLRTISMAVLPFTFFYIYYRLGLMEAEDFTWQLWVAIGLMIPAGWLLIWRLPPQRRLLAIVLMGALCAISFYSIDLLPPWILMSWIPMWIPIMLGAGVLVIICAFAFFPSHGRDAANRRSQQ